MIKFITELKLATESKSHKRVVDTFVVKIDDVIVAVPSGFRTNLASTPKWIHWLLPPDDPHYTRAAVVHDWLYAKAIVSRKDADIIFRKLSQYDGTSSGTAWFMFVCLRLFGSSHYNRKHSK